MTLSTRPDSQRGGQSGSRANSRANEEHFNGRARIVREIAAGVLAEAPVSFSLVGPKMVGKSRLLHFLASDEGPLMGDDFAAARPTPFRDAGRTLVVRIDADLPDAQSGFMAYLVEQVAAAIQREQLLPQSDLSGASHSLHLMTLLQRLSQKDYRPVLLLDSFDRVFATLPMDTVNELRPLTRLAAVVVATEQPLIDLDPDRSASPLFNMMTPIFIGLLEPDAARHWMELYAREHPGIRPCIDELLALTGTHPYLLRRMGDILKDVRRMLPGNETVGPVHMPLLRLRLAEYGRYLFEIQWRRLQSPPAPLHKPMVLALVRRLAEGPLPLAALGSEESSTVNWIFNQALIIFSTERSDESNSGSGSGESNSGSDGSAAISYEFFSPLLTEFLRERLRELDSAASTAMGAEDRAMDATGAAISATYVAATNGESAQATPSDATGKNNRARANTPPAPVGLAPDFVDKLTKTEHLLLGYFQSHSNQIIAPEQLLRDVWHRPDATMRRVQEAIRRLRAVLEKADPPIGTIENDRGRGYRFVPAPYD